MCAVNVSARRSRSVPACGMRDTARALTCWACWVTHRFVWRSGGLVDWTFTAGWREREGERKRRRESERRRHRGKRRAVGVSGACAVKAQGIWSTGKLCAPQGLAPHNGLSTASSLHFVWPKNVCGSLGGAKPSLIVPCLSFSHTDRCRPDKAVIHFLQF